MDWLQGVFNVLLKIWNEIKCFLPNLWARFLDVIVTLQEEISAALLAVLSVIPLPDAVQNFQWPDVGPLGYAVIQAGIPQALSILSGALFIRFIKGLLIHTKSG